MPDLAFTLFLSLGGHAELPCDKIFINPLPGYVENKAGDVESGLGLDEIALVLVRFDHIAGFVRPRHTARCIKV